METNTTFRYVVNEFTGREPFYVTNPTNNMELLESGADEDWKDWQNFLDSLPEIC